MRADARAEVDGADKLGSWQVDTRHLPARRAFSLWQEEIVPYWEVRPGYKARDRFASTTEIYDLGNMMLGTVMTPAQRVDRSRYQVARDGLTQYGLQIIVSGRIGQRDGTDADVARRPGDVLIADLAQCQTLEADDLSVLFFSVPRHAMAPLLQNPDHHNQRVLSGRDPLVGLLTSHLASLHHAAPQLESKAASAITGPTLALTAAVLNGQVTDTEADAVALTLTSEVRRYVERHIGEPGLCAGKVAAHFSMSLRKLYYLFEPFGGFSTYLRERRLDHVRAALCSPINRVRSIADVAEGFGFSNYSGFVRSFRHRFELTPREVRSLAAESLPSAGAEGSGNIWNDWLFRTR